MTDRKTASELCMTLLHLAAVEEEREAEDGTSMRERVNAMRFDRDAARKTRDLAHETMLAACAERDAAERLAADALRIGLEECERMRAELVKLATERSLLDAASDELRAGRAQLESARAALKGDREKVGEWW